MSLINSLIGKLVNWTFSYNHNQPKMKKSYIISHCVITSSDFKFFFFLPLWQTALLGHTCSNADALWSRLCENCVLCDAGRILWSSSGIQEGRDSIFFSFLSVKVFMDSTWSKKLQWRKYFSYSWVVHHPQILHNNWIMANCNMRFRNKFFKKKYVFSFCSCIC